MEGARAKERMAERLGARGSGEREQESGEQESRQEMKPHAGRVG